MRSIKVWQVSDTHLSASHAYFQDNWNEFVALVAAARPDLVVHSGDLAFNGPDVPEDLAFCRGQLERLAVPWVAIPGNHDIGEPGPAPRLAQPVNRARIAVWHEHLGAECFVRDIGRWRLVGLNCEVLGSGLAAEAAQWRCFDDALGSRGERPVGLFLHKPLFVTSPDEDPPGDMSVLTQPRRRILARIQREDVRFVASGHLHAYGQRQAGAVDCVWCPTTAFVNPVGGTPPGVVCRAGFIEWTLDADRHHHVFVEPPLFANLDISNWTKRSGTSITLPPRPIHRSAADYPRG